MHLYNVYFNRSLWKVIPQATLIAAVKVNVLFQRKRTKVMESCSKVTAIIASFHDIRNNMKAISFDR